MRGAGLAACGLISLILALVLAERLVRPEVIGEISTAGLFGLLMLFFLPPLTFFAIRHDARVNARLAALREAGVDDAGPVRMPEPVSERMPGRMAACDDVLVPAAGLASESARGVAPVRVISEAVGLSAAATPGERAVRHIAHHRAHHAALPRHHGSSPTVASD